MYFVAMVIKLKLLEIEQKLLTEDGVYVHAAVMSAITSADAEAGEKLHSMYRHKQVTMAIVKSDRKTTTLRMTFMTQDGLTYANTLINVLSVHPLFSLGRLKSEVETVSLADPDWAGIATWSDLTASENLGRHLHFQFVTPTAITKQDGNGGRFMSLFPDPWEVFSGLARRWQALGGPELPDSLERFIKAGGCVVSAHYLHTVNFRTAERTQVGFVGQTVYECRLQDRECNKALNTLTRFARFSGIGYQTARGMGAVQICILP